MNRIKTLQLGVARYWNQLASTNLFKPAFFNKRVIDFTNYQRFVLNCILA